MNKTYKSSMMALSAVVFFISCSESESLQQAHLSTDQINFIASMAHQWDANTKSAPQNPSSRSAGVRDNEAPIHVNANLAKPLYLHPVVQDGIHIWSKQGTPITRSGAPIEDVEQERVVQTRGSKKNDLIRDYSNFGVSALYPNGNAYESLFSDATATFTGKYWNIPNASNNSTWPIDSKVSFHAYAPHSSESNSMLKSSPDLTNVQTNIHYEAKVSSADIENQPDLIVATNAEKRSKTAANTPVALQFSHALTAVSFAMSSDLADVIGDGAQLTSVSLQNIPNEGDCQLIAQDDKHSSSSAIWKLDYDNDKNKKGTYTFDLSTKNITVGSDLALTDDNQTLMMIPQTLPDGAKLVFTFKLNNQPQPQVLTVNLNGEVWEAGKSVIYKLSAKAINTLDATDVTYPSTWTASSFPKSSFTTDDAIGLYVVDKNNQIVERNVKLTLGNDNKWTTDKKFLKLTGYKYFAYYPYNLDNSDDQMVNPSASDASTFFASKISSLSPASVQNTKEALLAQDFQVATGVVGKDASTLTFLMEHAMGLAEITLGAKTFDNNYYLSNHPSYTWKNGTTTFHACDVIRDYFLYKVADYRYVALVKPNITTDFSCGDTDNEDSWTGKVSVKPTPNSVARVTATSKRTSCIIQHELRVGDFFYRHGELTARPKDNSCPKLVSGELPIGIVVYTGNNRWTENTVSGKGGHALVMALKTIGSTGKKDRGAKIRWYPTDVDTGNEKIHSGARVRASFNQDYGSGYTVTKSLIAKSKDFEAAVAADNYNKTLPVPSNCTGWFLASVGQYYAMLTGLGGGITPDTWEFEDFFGNQFDLTVIINNAISIVGDDNYTEFINLPMTWEWSCNEDDFLDTTTFRIAVLGTSPDYNERDGWMRFGHIMKSNPSPIRPFLAF